MKRCDDYHVYAETRYQDVRGQHELVFVEDGAVDHHVMDAELKEEGGVGILRVRRSTAVANRPYPFVGVEDLFLSLGWLSPLLTIMLLILYMF